MRAEHEAVQREFGVERTEMAFDLAAFDAQVEIADAQVEQPLARERGPIRAGFVSGLLGSSCHARAIQNYQSRRHDNLIAARAQNWRCTRLLA